jgi:hypothetical protein
MPFKEDQMAVARQLIDGVYATRAFQMEETLAVDLSDPTAKIHDVSLYARKQAMNKSLGAAVLQHMVGLKLKSVSSPYKSADATPSVGPSAPSPSLPPAYHSPTYWLDLGRYFAVTRPTEKPRCNGASALAVHILSYACKFKASLEVYEAGGATSRWQHWFVVANHDDGLPLTQEKDGRLSDPQAFVIDFWGGKNDSRTSAVDERAFTGITPIRLRCRVRDRTAWLTAPTYPTTVGRSRSGTV